MKKVIDVLKIAFLGNFYLAPLWFCYVIIGSMINSLSTQGLNGEIDGFPQRDSAFLAKLGVVIVFFAVPGLINYLKTLLFRAIDL